MQKSTLNLDQHRWVCSDDYINTEGHEYYPSVTHSGDLYFTGEYPDGVGKEDIYVSRKTATAYSSPLLLDTSINTTTYEFNAFIDPDERYIIFGSYGRADGSGGGDLYISLKQADGQWGFAKNISSVNTPSLDYCPFVLNDQFYFTSERKAPLDSIITNPEMFQKYHQSLLNGGGNVYKVALSSIVQ